MNDARSYVAPFGLDAPLDGGAVGQVVKSGDDRLHEAEWVLHQLGWRELALTRADAVVPIDTELGPPSAYLGVLGMPGLTAYIGLLEIAQLREGESVFVSGAAGAVGSLAGQLAKVRGCRVVGSAGSAEKVAYLKDELGFDAAFNYRDGSVHEQREVGQRLRDGRVRYRETVVEGLEHAPDAFIGLLRGQNVGKMVVEIS